MVNQNQKTTIYLDYNATAPLRSCAREALIAALDLPMNASSVHSYGRKGRKLVEDTRILLGQTLGCPAAQIVFNSGATEGNNTLLYHFANSFPDERILIGATEHSSIYKMPLKNVTKIPVDANGVIKLDALETLLEEPVKTSLVCVMMANNETGTVQPIQQIAALAHRYGAMMHCDATQGLGRFPLDLQALGCDSMTVSSHKIGGPQGVGALALMRCGVTPTLIHGGGQERKLRSGTENVAAIAGFGAAITESCTDSYIETETARLKALQTKLENGLKQLTPDIIIHAEGAQRMTNTTLISLPSAKTESLLMALDLEGVALSSGSACSSGTVKASHVLEAMGITQPTLRLSTGYKTKESEIDAFLDLWQTITTRQHAA